MSAFYEQYGYKVAYYPTIQDGPVFRWTRGGLEVNASRSGVGVVANGRIGDILSFKNALESAMYIAGRLMEDDHPDGLFFDSKFIPASLWLAATN